MDALFCQVMELFKAVLLFTLALPCTRMLAVDDGRWLYAGSSPSVFFVTLE